MLAPPTRTIKAAVQREAAEWHWCIVQCRWRRTSQRTQSIGVHLTKLTLDKVNCVITLVPLQSQNFNDPRPPRPPQLPALLKKQKKHKITHATDRSTLHACRNKEAFSRVLMKHDVRSISSLLMAYAVTWWAWNKSHGMRVGKRTQRPEKFPGNVYKTRGDTRKTLAGQAAWPQFSKLCTYCLESTSSTATSRHSCHRAVRFKISMKGSMNKNNNTTLI